jgi:predicted anti-sigma-YlaC factor YlaD
MKCEQIQKKLSAFIDDELNKGEVGLIREHLKTCRECAEELQALGSVWDFMETGEEVEPSPYFWTRLSAEIASREKERSLRWGFWRKLFSNPIPVAAAVALILGLLLGNIVGRMLYPNGSYLNSEATADVLALNTFDDMPAGSLSDAYYSLLTENGGEQ